MPDFADSSGAVIAIIAESTFDTTPASPGFQKLRFTSESLNYTPNRVTSNEITTNAGVSDLVEVGAQNAGDISFEWSYGADFDLILEGSLRATFTTGTTTAGVTVTGVEALGSPNGNATDFDNNDLVKMFDQDTGSQVRISGAQGAGDCFIGQWFPTAKAINSVRIYQRSGSTRTITAAKIQSSSNLGESWQDEFSSSSLTDAGGVWDTIS